MFKVIISKNFSFQGYQNKNLYILYIRIGTMNKNANSADVRHLTRPTQISGKSLD